MAKENEKMKEKYSGGLFFAGFLMNLLKEFPLTVPALILCIAGIWVRPCLYIGIGLFAAAIVIALITQFRYKKAVENCKDPNFEPWANAMKSKNWRRETIDMVNEKIEAQNAANENPEDPEENETK